MSKITPIPHQLTETVKLLHKTAIVTAGQALILKRAADSKSRPGKWDLPGGNSEWPSNQNDFAKNLHQLDIAREIKEETGLVVKPEVFTVDNLVYFTTFYNPQQQIYSINCGWQVRDVLEAPQDTVQISAEHTQYEWIHLSQLDEFDFGPAERDFEKATIRRALSI